MSGLSSQQWENGLGRETVAQELADWGTETERKESQGGSEKCEQSPGEMSKVLPICR